MATWFLDGLPIDMKKKIKISQNLGIVLQSSNVATLVFLIVTILIPIANQLWGIFLSIPSFAHKKIVGIHLFFDFVETHMLIDCIGFQL
jgi:hypothetical protein